MCIICIYIYIGSQGGKDHATLETKSFTQLRELKTSWFAGLLYLAALGRIAINLMFSCLLKKPNKPKKAKDVKLQ